MRREKAVLFHFPIDPGLHATRYQQERELLRRLHANFELVMIEAECDYRDVLAAHTPAVALFESGKDVPARRFDIHHAGLDTSVPKLLLVRCDCYAPRRAEVLADFERWQPDACFTYDPLYRHYLQAIADRLCFMPHSIDPALFRDYGLRKDIDVLIVGAPLPHRPWRVRAGEMVQRHFVCTVAPHDRHTETSGTRMVHGEAYARLLNRARFVLAEGSVIGFPVRKLFEVPAAGACLVTPPGPSLAELGFVDMVNCVIAEAEEVPGKIGFLMQNPERYQAVVEAGTGLVRARHRDQHRTQLADWLHAWRRGHQDPPPVQSRLLGRFADGGAPAVASPPPPVDRRMIEESVAWLEAGELDLAEAALRRCLEFLPGHFSEPLFYLGLIALLRGKPLDALYHLLKNFVQQLLPAGVERPDPLEAAYLILAYLCNGQRDRALRLTRETEDMQHPELARARWLAVDPQQPPLFPRIRATPTLYTQLRPAPLARWLTRVAEMAKASGQLALQRDCRRLAEIHRRAELEARDVAFLCVLDCPPHRSVSAWLNTAIAERAESLVCVTAGREPPSPWFRDEVVPLCTYASVVAAGPASPAGDPLQGFPLVVRRDAYLLAGGLNADLGLVAGLADLGLRLQASGGMVLDCCDGRGVPVSDEPSEADRAFLQGAWGDAAPSGGASGVQPGLRGAVDTVFAGAAHGWISEGVDAAPSHVTLHVDGLPVSWAVADLYRPDLEASGLGNGRLGFSLPLPRRYRDGRPHRYAVRSSGGSWLPSLHALHRDAEASAEAAGAFERMEGRVCHGWAAPDATGAAAVVHARVDGVLVGSAPADVPRPDLLAIAPQGRCGFALELPAELFAGGGFTVTIESEGRALPGGPHSVSATQAKALASEPSGSRTTPSREARTAAAARQSRVKVLMVVHDQAGGMILTTDDLVSALQDRAEIHVLAIGARQWTLLRDGGVTRVVDFEQHWYVDGLPQADREAAFLQLCRELGPDVVHLRTIIGLGPTALVGIRQAGIPLVVSVHDFQSICPTVFLIDERGWYCGGACTSGEGSCPVSSAWFETLPALKHNHVREWRERMAVGLAAADRLVACTEGTRRLFLAHFPSLTSKPFHIIEHGREPVRSDTGQPPGADEPARIVCLGSLNRAKGLERIEAVMLAAQRRSMRVEFHFAGDLEDMHVLALGGIHYGRYVRDGLQKTLEAIRPSFSLMLPIWPETYSHTLTESWLAGIPVIASRRGALEERIGRHGGGWLVEPWDADSVLDTITGASEPEEYGARLAEIKKLHLPDQGDMGNEYLGLYNDLAKTQTLSRNNASMAHILDSRP